MTLALSVAGLGAIALLVILFVRREHRPIPPPVDEPAPITKPASSEPEAADKKPAPRPPAAPVARRAGQARVVPDASPPPNEESLLAQLHELAGSDPDRSLIIAREAVRRFPDSPNAPEFEWNVVKALFNLRRLDDAEAEARVMLSKYPNSSFTGDVVHHLLNHPPNPPGVP